MPFIMRPFSLNKVWFCTNCVDLRITDISSINSKCKAWLYQDMLEKHQEMVLYRTAEQGGLGLHKVKFKALASLITTFLQTAANPRFRTSLYHSSLFIFHILKEETIPDPGFPPYYDEKFFDTIRHYHENSPLYIIHRTSKQWYRALVEDNVTMSPDPDNPTIPRVIPCKV